MKPDCTLSLKHRPCPYTNCPMHTANLVGSTADHLCGQEDILAAQGDEAKTCEVFGCSPRDLREDVKQLRFGLLVVRFFQHVTGRSLIDGRAQDFDKVESSPAAWARWPHRTDTDFHSVVRVLRRLRDGL